MFLSRPTLQSVNSSLTAQAAQNIWHALSDWSPEDQDSEEPGRWRTFRETQLLLRREGGEEGRSVDCCPSVLEMVEPEGGRNQEDMFVELYREGDNRQRFYELSCRADIENKPCRFMDRKLHNQSRCVQQFSYTYALVREPETLRHHHRPHHFPSLPSFPSGGNWMLDYIRVRSGCSCQLMPKAKNKRTLPGKTKRAKLKSK